MQPQYSKDKSSAFTVDTYGPNSSTFGHSLFQKQANDGSNQIIQQPSSLFTIDQDQPNPFAERLKVNVRQKYIYRVLGNEEEQKLPSIKRQHVFIYDWDDTLLFTTHLKGKNFTELSEECKKYLKQLDQIVCMVLEYSFKKGFVFIITNSVEGWVSYSSKLYVPKTHKLINSSERVKIWSARELFHQLYPNDLKMWKVQAYRKLKEHLRTNILTNVVCIGDRQDDLEACQILVQDFQNIYIKKIKFQQKPNPEELIKQLRLLEKKFQQIFYAISNTTIKLAKRVLTPETLRRHTQNNFRISLPKQ